MASKTSAVADNEPVDVLFALHDKFDFLDFAGPLEVLTTALHDINDPCKHPAPPLICPSSGVCPPDSPLNCDSLSSHQSLRGHRRFG